MGFSAFAAQNVMITEVPDYSWYAGCWGTAGGNLMGYWDRHGLPDFLYRAHGGRSCASEQLGIKPGDTFDVGLESRF